MSQNSFLADGVAFTDVGFDHPEWIKICQADPTGPTFEVLVKRLDFQEIEARQLALIRENAENTNRPPEYRIREVERRNVDEVIAEIRGLTAANANKCVRVKRPLDPKSPAIADRESKGLTWYDPAKWRDVVWWLYVNSPNSSFWKPINDFSTNSVVEQKARDTEAKKSAG